ncbi:hypothetical protein [Stutzerimonas stutzeri]|uniref:hypothetical protein n=1 Tax=Stutzerimonas stutzeri TaxID=316 RepID=UPI00210A9DAF|nr:hypothetical protein [Stutzerimonas stutzeri]MCQ4242394.1 hypothetical protein [Stutzerimonas stutzeri]
MNLQQPDLRAMPRVRIANYAPEKLCTKCAEYWPADGEFFYTAGQTRLSSWCKACTNEVRNAKRRAKQ